MMINRDSTFGVKWSEVAVNLLDRWQELVSGKRLDSWSSIGHLFARDIAVILWPSLYRQGLVQRGLLEGKMFGLLLAQQGDDKHLPERDDCYLSLAGGYVLLFAYSGQINGVWNWPGWSPSPSDLQLTAGESWRVQRDLHMLTDRFKGTFSTQSRTQVTFSIACHITTESSHFICEAGECGQVGRTMARCANRSW